MTNCNFRLFGMMPTCALPAGHDGDHADGFGGTYREHETIFMGVDEIPAKKFGGGSVGGRTSPRTWFKRFTQLWPGFKAAPRFRVTDDGELEYRAADGVVRIAAAMLFPQLPPVVAGQIVEVDF